MSRLLSVDTAARTVLERISAGQPPLADCDGPGEYCDRLDALRKLQADRWIDADRQLTAHGRGLCQELGL